jgi:hypothetical protein
MDVKEQGGGWALDLSCSEQGQVAGSSEHYSERDLRF